MTPIVFRASKRSQREVGELLVAIAVVSQALLDELQICSRTTWHDGVRTQMENLPKIISVDSKVLVVHQITHASFMYTPSNRTISLVLGLPASHGKASNIKGSQHVLSWRKSLHCMVAPLAVQRAQGRAVIAS